MCRFSCLCIPPGSPQEIQLAPDDPPVGIGHHPLRGNVQRPQVEHLHHRRSVREGGLPVGHFPQGGVEALNRVGRVDHFPDLGRVRKQPFHITETLVPDPHRRWIPVLPLLIELRERPLGCLLADRPIDFLEIGAEFLAALAGDVLGAVPDQMDHTAADHRGREGVRDGFLQPLQTVDADKAQAFHSSGLQLVKDAQPLMGSLIFSDPEAEAVLLSVNTDPDHGIDRAFPGFLLSLDRDHQRVHIHERIDLFQPSGLPLHDARLDQIHDVGDGLMTQGETIDLLDNL